MTFAWPFKIKEHFTIEPSISSFNVFNFANFDGSVNKLLGILNGGTSAAFLNVATAANRAGNRVGAGSGVFALGAPRQMEFGLKIKF